MIRRYTCPLAILTGVMLLGCEDRNSDTEAPDIRFRNAANVASGALDEISGIQASHSQPDIFWVHNDDGPARVYAVDQQGQDRGYFDITDGVNVDWEDITMIPGQHGDALVLADIGDNHARRSKVWMYIVPEPMPGEDGNYTGEVAPLNWISLSYPDGPRDAESVAWDPLGEQILILSKRDQPPRLYALPWQTALNESEAELEYLGEVDRFRPATAKDQQVFGEQVNWISQPTGMDISRDGRHLAIITYRSLYLFERAPNQTWPEAFQSKPIEVIGPPRVNEEAVGWSHVPGELWVTSEGLEAPLYHFLTDQAEKPVTPEPPTETPSTSAVPAPASDGD